MGCGPSKLTDAAVASPEPVTVKAQEDARPVPTQRAEAPETERILAPKYTQDVTQVYNLGKILGKGQFGTTRIAVRKDTGEKFACKTISKRKLIKQEDRDDVRLEVSIMDHLSGHPHVVKLVDAFEDKRNVHIVMELCTGGELFDRIVSRGHYSEKGAAAVIRAVLEVVAHCHAMGVVHRDLKPENFLLSDVGPAAELKAIDFGLSTFFKPEVLLSDIVGSAYYVAPEVLRKSYGSECDIWSCGVILYILLCGTPPFYAETETGIFRAIIKDAVDFESHPWPRISQEAKDCVRKMLMRDVNQRATAQQILAHPWMSETGVASDEPLENEIQQRLKGFYNMNKLKRQALRLIASYMPAEEVQGLRNQFEALDVDKSGTVTVEELHKALQASNSKLPREDIVRLMENLDMNGSGAIDYEEFLAATLHASKVEKEDNLKRAFQEFDKDSSGMITKQELQRALGVVGGYDPGEINEILAIVDKNGDGNIDYEEFVEMMTPQDVEPVRRKIRHIKF